MALYMAAQTDSSDPFLNPDKVKIDERSRAQLFTMLYKLSRQFWYYNSQGQKEGDWSAFFESDLTSLFAIISQETKQQEFDKILSLIHGTDQLKGGECQQFLIQSLKLVIDTAIKLNGYYMTITRSFYKHPFQVYLNDMIGGQLSMSLKEIWQFYAKGMDSEDQSYPWLNEAYQALKTLPVIWGIGISVESNTSPWHFEEDELDTSVLDLFCKASNDCNLAKTELIDAFRGFYAAYERVVERAGACLKTALQAGNTQPHIALIFAFLKLFRHQQNLSNELPAKYLNFYYHDVLRFQQRPAQPDEAYVLFTLNKNIDALRLDKGTLLSAGETEEGDPISFATQEAVLLSSAVLTELKVAKVEKSGLKVGSIEAFQKPQLDENTGQYKTFSLTEPANVPPVPVPPKTVGFAISSPCLVLNGGEREVTLRITEPSTDITCDFLKKCKLSLTTANGWFPVVFKVKKINKGEISERPCPCTKTCINISIVLSVVDPEIVAYDEEIHGTGYKSGWPILKCESPLQFKSMLEINQLTFCGKVTDFKDLYLYTPDGEVTMEASALSLFGNEPVKGSEFIVGAYEPFVKPLTKASITLDWFNLTDQNGFQSYYQTYIDYSNRKVEREFDLTKVHRAVNACIETIREEINKCKILAGCKIRDAEKDLKKLYDQAETCVADCENDHNECVTIYAIKAWKIIINLIISLNISLKVICEVWDLAGQLREAHKNCPAWSDKDSYKVQLFTLYKGHWCPTTNPLNHCTPLFPSELKTGTYIFISLACKDPKLKPDLLLANPPVLDQNATSGFFKFSLTAPSDPFAHQLYLQVFNWIVMKNGENVAKNVANPLCPQLPIHDLPNPPYIPQVRQVSMNYHFAQKTGVDNHNQLYWLLEDEKGVLRIKEAQCDKVELEKAKAVRLENEIKEGQSTLLLGFEGLKKGTVLSLYFGIAESQISSDKQPIIEVQTEDEKHNKTWKNLTVLSNTTSHWQQEGIIRVKIVHEPVSGYLEEEDGLYWLKIILEKGRDIKLTMLGTNALKVKRQLTSDSQKEMQVIPASTIAELLDNLPAIDTVYQPFDSFGFKEIETTPQFRHRVANRLRFKDRALSVLACQRLILDHFKEVFLVDIKLSPQNPNGPEVEVFILPWIDSQTNPQKYEPKAKPALIEAVRSFLQDKINSLVWLEVKCLGFEKIEVKAEVIFRESSEKGDLTEKLNTRLKDYLSPWIKNQPESRNAKYLDINKLGVFIENLPYVKSLTALVVCLGTDPSVHKRTGIIWPLAPGKTLLPKVTLPIPKSKELEC